MLVLARLFLSVGVGVFVSVLCTCFDVFVLCARVGFYTYLLTYLLAIMSFVLTCNDMIV